MFDKVFEIDEIKEIFIQRKSALKNFNKITVNDDFYLSFLSRPKRMLRGARKI